MDGESLRLQVEKRKLVLFDAAVATQRTSYRFDLMRTGEDSIRTCTTGFLVGFESGENVSFQCSSKDAMSIVMQVKQLLSAPTDSAPAPSADGSTAFMDGFSRLGQAKGYEPGNAQEREIIKWMQAHGVSVPDGPLMASLRSGVLLCQLANAIKPNSVAKINKMSQPFVQMENVAAFLAACAELGVRPEDSFQTTDLYESRQLGQVLLCLGVLKRTHPAQAKRPLPVPKAKAATAKKKGPPPSAKRGTVKPRGAAGARTPVLPGKKRPPPMSK